MGRIIILTSGKGGVGKTTVSAMLGAALSTKYRVVMIDADVGLNNLDVTLGVEGKIVYDLGDVLDRRCRIRQALVEAKENLYLLASAKGIPNDKSSAAHLRRLTDELQNDFDFVLVDCPAGIEAGFHRAVSASDEAIVVTTPNISAVRDADKVLTLLTTYDVAVRGVVVNRVKDGFFNPSAVTGAEVARLLRTPFLGSVPDDAKTTRERETGEFRMSGKAQKAVFKIAEELAGSPPKDKNAMFKKLFKEKRNTL